MREGTYDTQPLLAVTQSTRLMLSANDLSLGSTTGGSGIQDVT